MRAYRRQKIASVIRQVIADAILHRMHDPRVEPLTAVTRVEMSLDLLVARVFLTIPGDAGDETRTLQAIRHAGGYMQRRVAAELTLRNCPELRFDVDQSTKGTTYTLKLLAQNRLDDPDLVEPEKNPENASTSDADGADPGKESTPDPNLESGL